jgi:hypothetical protein
MYYGAWDVFIHWLYVGGLLSFVGLLLFVVWLMWAMSRAGDSRPIRMRTVLR